jgi:hypothetical protein
MSNDDGHEARKIAVAHAAHMQKRGKLSQQEHDDVLKLAARDHLAGLDMDQYAELRNSGDLERIMKDSGFADDEEPGEAQSRAEKAARHVIQDFVTTSWQAGHIDEKEAVKILSSVVDLEGESDGDKMMNHSLYAAEPDYRPADREQQRPPWAPEEVEGPNADEVAEFQGRAGSVDTPTTRRRATAKAPPAVRRSALAGE